jgi:anti-anti-sigma factor
MGDFEIKANDVCTVVKVLKDKLDTNLAPKLKSEFVIMAGKGEKNIILDLSETKYCDSSGLSAILIGNRLCRRNNGVFVLSGLQIAVERLIQISQLDTVLDITDTAQAGIEFIKNTQ